MKILALTTMLVAFSSAATKDGSPTDPNASLAKTLGGKVWVGDGSPSSGGEPLRSWLAARNTAGEIGRKGQEGTWTVPFVAVFKKPILKGPITVQLFDKAHRKNAIDQVSLPNDAATFVFRGTCELDPDHGFTKGETYVMVIGQIVGGTFHPDAAGELVLK